MSADASIALIERHRRLARAAFSARDAEALDDACHALIQAAPEDAEPRRLLGRQALRDLRLDDAEHYLREAAAYDPTSPISWIDVARILIERRRTAEAEATLAAAERRGVRSATFLTFLGALQTALAQTDEAIATLEAGVDLDPDYTQAHYWLADLGALRVGEPVHRRLLNRVNADDLPAARRAMGLFALAEAAAQDGDHDAFVAHILAANAAQADTLTGGAAHLDALKRAVKTGRRTGAKPTGALDSDPPLVFILSSPGGGAEMAEFALAQVSEIRPGGHLGALAGPTVSLANAYDARPPVQTCASYDHDTRVRLAETYLARAHQLDGDLIWSCSDCDPANTALAPLAAALFDNAKFVRVARPREEAGVAVLRRAFSQPALHQCDLRAIGRGVALTEAALDAFCARREDVVTVDYAALRADPDAQGRALADALGLPLRSPGAPPPAPQAGGFAAWLARRADTHVGPDDVSAFGDALSPMVRAL